MSQITITPPVTLPLATTSGGTGASTAASARVNLGTPSRFLSVGSIDNLGITYSSNVLSVTQKDGSALADTDGSRAYVVCPSTTAGQEVVLAISAAQTLQDAGHGSPQILGRLGTTASVAWASALPLYIGIVNKDDTSANARFFLTRDPTKTTTPSSVDNIGIGGTAASTSAQGNIILFGTEANTGYNSKPCVIIGSVQATCDNSAGGSWTIGSLSAGRDGIGLFQENVSFTMAVSQNGAGTGGYLKNNGGTAPAMTTQNYYYYIRRTGEVHIYFSLSGDAGTDGSGAVRAQLALPYVIADATSVVAKNVARLQFGSVNSYGYMEVLANTTTCQFLYFSVLNTLSGINNSDFINGGREISGNFPYQAF